MEGMRGSGPCSYRETIGSGGSIATSSSSGNTLSTTTNHTSGSGSCHLRFVCDQVVRPPGYDDERREKLEHVKDLLAECCGGTDGKNNHVERWFSELGVGWVLHHADDDASAGFLSWQDQHDLAGKWIQALADITESILDTHNSCFSRSHLQLSPVAETLPEEPQEANTAPDPVHFSRFTQETMLKMLSFVDAMVAPNPNTSCSSDGAPSPLEKLKTLLDVRGALFMASFLIQPTLLQTERRAIDDMESLRSKQDDKLAEAIWNTMQEVTDRILADDGNSDSWDTPQGSSSIHKVTRSVERYIRLLEINYRSVDQIVRKAANSGTYVPEIYNTNPFTSMITEMVACLEEKLAKISRSFPNQSLGFLFLINNLQSLRQQLHPMYDMKFNMPALTSKIEDYIQNYLQVSWAPVLSCLHTSPSPLRLGRRCSPLTKFESEFRKKYSDQKLWKVPDPELRNRLRKAITEKVASGFTNYLEDNNTISAPGSTLTPQELEEMLQELFEG